MNSTFRVKVNNKEGKLIFSNEYLELKFDQVRIRDSEPNIKFTESRALYEFLEDKKYNICFDSYEDCKKCSRLF